MLKKMIGNVTTRHYSYNVGCGNKLSGVTIASMDEHCQAYREKHQLPATQIDTNGAYQLATQWLAMSRMDVHRLNRDCEAQIKISRFWNEINRVRNSARRLSFRSMM